MLYEVITPIDEVQLRVRSVLEVPVPDQMIGRRFGAARETFDLFVAQKPPPDCDIRDAPCLPEGFPHDVVQTRGEHGVFVVEYPERHPLIPVMPVSYNFV